MTPKEEIEKKLQPFRKQVDDLRKEKETVDPGRALHGAGHSFGTAGYSSPTPVTNGREVFVALRQRTRGLLSTWTATASG